MKHMVSRKRQSGFTAMELIVVVVVGLIILAVGAGKISQLFGKSDESTEITNTQMLLTSTKSLRSSNGYGTAGTDLVTPLIAINGVPASVTQSGGKLYNTWNGQITIVAAAGGLGYTLTSPSIPADKCIMLAKDMSAGGTVSTTSINGGAGLTGAVPLATATTQCNAATNTIAWTVNS